MRRGPDSSCSLALSAQAADFARLSESAYAFEKLSIS
jgi:hypothetical protein